LHHVRSAKTHLLADAGVLVGAIPLRQAQKSWQENQKETEMTTISTIKKLAATSAIGATLSLGAVGLGAGLAHANPDTSGNSSTHAGGERPNPSISAHDVGLPSPSSGQPATSANDAGAQKAREDAANKAVQDLKDKMEQAEERARNQSLTPEEKVRGVLNGTLPVTPPPPKDVVKGALLGPLAPVAPAIPPSPGNVVKNALLGPFSFLF
jgi:hypothetical protein